MYIKQVFHFIYANKENLKTWKIIPVMYATYATMKRKPEKKGGLNVISIYDFCDTRAVLYQLS